MALKVGIVGMRGIGNTHARAHAVDPLSDLVAVHPAPAAMIAITLGTVSLQRLFSHSILRRRPFQPTSPFPGSYSLERSAEFERERQAARKPRATRWQSRYLGTDAWNWARAALYESYGPVSWKTLVTISSRGQSASRVLSRRWKPSSP